MPELLPFRPSASNVSIHASLSVSSEYDTSRQSGGDSYSDSDGESSATSSLPATQKCPHKIRIKGAAWILHGEITTNLRHNDTSMDGDGRDDDDDTKIQNTKSQEVAALGAKFESLFGKMLSIVKHFVFFCNLVNIMHAGPAAATTVKIQIRDFLQVGKCTRLPRVMGRGANPP